VHGLSECLNIGVVGIKVAADPLEPLGMFQVVRISDCIEELVVSPGASDILGWAASGCVNQARIRHAWEGISDALDADGMLPAIAEVVEVFERPGADSDMRIRAANLPLVSVSLTDIGAESI
jgi:hypothetical protein